ncbi:MAG: M48 family metallopeptidase [Bacteroidetes bacterium]|nr:M48 family metallopeptidase [Bacteroidota bacterium]
MKKFFVVKIVFAFILLFTGSVYGQYDSNYMPLTSSGLLPEEFLKTARSISEEDIKTIGYGTDRMAKQQFTISSNYFLRDLLLSGDVLINDPLGNYVNKVADELLKNDPELRKQIHIYVTKSPDVNAHAFDKGFIFINVGLLAQLENEAQLAYVLAHEITHVVKKHSVNQYIENIKLDKGTSSYETGSYEARNIAKYRFSQDNETEADAEGLARIKESRYSVKALNGAFDVLQYSYLPFELVDFKKSFFEDQYLILPDTFFLKKTAEIKSNDDYDDTKSTHPNIRKRRGAVEPELAVLDEASRKKYIVSEEEFKKVREIARFESCRLYLVDRDYINAIYASYILLEKYPENVYLKKVVAKALYNITIAESYSNRNKSKYTYSIANNARLSSKSYSIPDYEKIEGPSQRVYYLLDQLDAKELNTLALSYTYKAYKKNPQDLVLSALTDSLFSELVNSNQLYLNDFSKTSKAQLLALDTVKTPVETVDTTAEESKYSKIKKQQQKVEITTDENFTKYAFVGLLEDAEFVKRFTRASKGLTRKAEEKKDNLTYKERKKLEDQIAKENKNKYTLLGIEKVLFLEPFYMKVKTVNREEMINYFESEEKQVKLAEIQKKCADRLKLNYEMISTKNMTTADMDRYNLNSIMNDWLTERFNHGDNSDEMIVGSDEIKTLIEKYGTKYLAWTGIYNEKGKKSHNTYFFILFNLENGEVMKYETRYTKSKDNTDLVTSFVYNSLMHVAKKPK